MQLREEKNALSFLTRPDDVVIEQYVMHKAGKLRELFVRDNKKQTKAELHVERLRVGCNAWKRVHAEREKTLYTAAS